MAEPGPWIQPDDEWLNQPGAVSYRAYGAVSLDTLHLSAVVGNAKAWTSSGSAQSSFVNFTQVEGPEQRPLWQTMIGARRAVIGPDPGRYPLRGPEPWEIPPGATVEYESDAGQYLGGWRLRRSITSAIPVGGSAPKGVARASFFSPYAVTDGYPGRDAMATNLALTATPGTGTASQLISVSEGQTVGWIALTQMQWEMADKPEPGTKADAETAIPTLAVEGLYRPPRYRIIPAQHRAGVPPLRHRQNSLNSGGPPLRHRQNGGQTGGPPLRHRQTGL